MTHPYFYAFLLLLAGQVADYVTTRIALQRGAFEMNPIVRLFGLSTVKLFDTLILLCTLLWLPPTFTVWAGLIYGLFFGAAAAWNIRILEHLPKKG